MSAISNPWPALRSATGPDPEKFPAVRYATASSYFDAYAEEMVKAWKAADFGQLDNAATILIEAYTKRVGVFACGNGGSASIANHLQCDHIKGIRTKTDLVPRVVSLSNNVELLTAIANDISYDEIFSYQLQSQASAGDVLIAISSSGRSTNIIRAVSWARDNGLRTIALTGFAGEPTKYLADAVIHFPCTNYGIVEDLHQAAMHALAQYIRQSRMTSEIISETVF